MTHTTNCTIVGDARDIINDLAARIYEHNRVPDDIASELGELGFNKLGSGAGRSVWMIPQEVQEGPIDTIVQEQPCVIKFATQHFQWDGRQQNRSEIEQFQEFPEHIASSDEHTVPIVNPIPDWHHDYLWLTQPYVDMEGGNAYEAEERLAEQEWFCEDLKYDNVGEMHHRSVVVDYGLDCGELTIVQDEAEHAAEVLENMDAQAVKVLEEPDPHEVMVEFRPPMHMPGSRNLHNDSHITIGPARNDPSRAVALWARFSYGSWDDLVVDEDELMDPANRIADEVIEANVHDIWIDSTHDGALAVNFEIQPGSMHGRQMSASSMVDEWKKVTDEVARMFPDDRTHEDVLEDIRQGVQRQIDDDVMQATTRGAG